MLPQEPQSINAWIVRVIPRTRVKEALSPDYWAERRTKDPQDEGAAKFYVSSPILNVGVMEE
jgi:hypothetical protein